MKKNKIKDYLKNGILLLAIPLLLLNCEKENSFELNQVDNKIIYKVTSLDNLIDLKPVIENVKNVNSKGSVRSKSSDNFLNLTNINTKEIIQYTNQTGYSTYTFKFENDSESINFENLYLHETENGYIAYILSYEPDPNWYYSNLSPEGFLSFDIATYQGNITKYSLEREIIWSTKEELISKSSLKNTTAKTSATGYFVEICVISPPAPCDENRHSDATGWDECAYSDGRWNESCQTVWASGGSTYPNDNPDDGTSGDGGGGTTTDNTDCTSVSGTSISDSQPISGITTDCAPNTTTGISITSEYQAFWMNLSPSQQDFLKLRPITKENVLSYLYNNNYAPQAQKLVTNTINENNDFLSKNNSSFETENFSILAFEAILKGGSVDYVDRIIIDSSFENSVANCAYKLLKDNNQFNQILDKLIPKNSKYSVTFKVGAASGNGGSTTASYGVFGDIIVTINEDLVATGNIISIAETILHESVHARLFEMVKSIRGLNKLDEFINEDSEIGKLAAYYNKYGKTELQHEFIWENYVDEIAKGTEAFHKLFPENYTNFHNNMQVVNGYIKATFYQSVAKAGLNKTSYFKSLDSTTQTNVLNMHSYLKANGKKITNAKTCQ